MKISPFFLLIKGLFFLEIYGQITAGPNNPGTITNVSCSFAYGAPSGYSPPGNVATSNNIYASFVHCACCDANTQCLYARNFGFSIPAGSIIQGIQVDVEKSAQLGANVQDNGIRLSKAGVEVGNNYMSAANWPSIDTYVSYGSCSDLWGTTWTATDINDPNFGVYFASIDYSGNCSFAFTSYIDHIRIRVCYNPPLPLYPFEMFVIPDKKQKKLTIHIKKKFSITNNVDSVLVIADRNQLKREIIFSSSSNAVSDNQVIVLNTEKEGVYTISLYVKLRNGEYNLVVKENYEMETDNKKEKLFCINSRCMSLEENAISAVLYTLEGKKIGEYNLSGKENFYNESLLTGSGLYLLKIIKSSGDVRFSRFFNY